MKLNLIPNFTARNWTLLVSALLLTLVTACGGGNGSAGKPVGSSSSSSSSTSGSSGSSGTYTLTAVAPATTPFKLAAYGTTTITVQVNSAGSAYTAAPVTVTFTSACASAVPSRATMAASATTSATNGQASVTYTDNGCGTTDTVVATANGATVNIPIEVATAPVAAIKFVSIIPSTASIVFSGSGGAGRTSSAVLTYEVVDASGNPIGGVPVTFTNNNNGLAPLSATTGTTATGTGQVTTSVTAVGATNGVFPAPGTLEVTASASLSGGGTVSAISGFVIVATGTPVNITMVAQYYNISGIDLIGNHENITFYLSDIHGDPVVDGTPVVAGTTEGGVGGSTGNQAGCTTVNGSCSLIFTTQNPRVDTNSSGVVEYGIATVTASSSPLSATIKIYMSGNYPYFYTNNAGTVSVIGSGSTFSIGASCSASIPLYFSDEVGNPMPKGETIAAASLTSNLSIGSVTPSVMPDFGDTNPVDALTPAASLSNYLTAYPTDPNTTKPKVNKYIFASQINIPVTLTAPCNASGTPDAGTASFTLTMTDPASSTSWVATFNVTYPE